MFLPHPRVKVSIVGSLRDREVVCSASDRQGSNFESSVWRTVSSQSSHHPQEVLLAQFSLYVHKGGLKPDSFHFIFHFGRHHNHESANILKKMISIYCLTLYIWQPSWILPTMQCPKVRSGHTTISGVKYLQKSAAACHFCLNMCFYHAF